VERALKPLMEEEIRGWDADRLMRAFRSLERDVLLHWHAPLSNDLFAMIYFGALSKMVAPGLLNDLLCGEGGIISTEPAKRLSRLARTVRGSAALSALFAATPDDAALWRALEGHPAFRAELDAYLRRFGARCAMELKLETVPLDDDPPALLRLLRGYLAGPLPAEGHERELRAAAEAKVFGERNWAKGLLLRYVLARTRRSIKHRENQRFERTRCVAVVRRIFQGLGRRLAEAGLIEAERDIFYLEKEEVFGCLDGGGVDADLKALVLARKAQYAAYAAGPVPPDRFRTRGPLAMARLDETPPAAKEGALAGLGCCPGKVRARVRLVGDPRTAPDLNGFIMAAERTDPGWTLLFPACKGILVERGSLLSHSAIVAREMGIPCVVGIPGLMRVLKDGEELEMDGATGEIIRMEAS
jgi:phosphohistidine swiveling domain-containing protein